jgi:hypothetical protein
MFAQRLFNHSAALMAGLVSRLIFSRWARGYEEHHDACEDAYAAHIGPLHLEVNRCFVLDHDDAYVGIRIPTLHRSNGRWQWGRLHLGYRFCQGDEQVRQTGVDVYWFRPLLRLRSVQVPKEVYGQACPLADNEYFPF